MENKVEEIKKVQVATEAAMSAVISYLVSEDFPTSERAHEIIDQVLSKYDCESPEGHIVASGHQSFAPHQTGNGPISTGIPIVIDIFPQSKITGYWADMSRTICLGTADAKLQKMYDCVLGAQELAIAMLGPGVVAGDVHDAVQRHFVSNGYLTSGVGSEFTYLEGLVHSTGHGLGKDIHQAPRIGFGSQEVLKVGDVVTIEPGLYYQNIGGIRIEDLLVITESGCENLTKFSRQFSYNK